ncbi:MAG: hypothetical protein ACYS8W_18800 [Planctomycetota bacterium]|jgi:hypothetical protein
MKPADEEFLGSLASKLDIAGDRQAIIEELYGYAVKLPPTEANAFLSAAAEQLEIEPLHLNVVDFPSRSPRSIRLAIHEDEIQFMTDNYGAKYMSELFGFLAESEAEFEFVHVGEQNEVLRKASLPFTVSRVPGFPDADDEFPGAESELLPPVEFDPYDIFALQFIDLTPADLPVTAGRIYRVMAIRTEETMDSWRKSPLSPDPARNVPFEITGDDGNLIVLIICLDDPGVLFFTQEEIERLLI